jgi:magnesium transporter
MTKRLSGKNDVTGTRPKAVRREPGTAPGTLSVPAEWPEPKIRIMAYGPDDYVERGIDDPSALQESLERWPVTWIDVRGLGDAEVIAELGASFGLHRLAVEDVVNVDQRAKVEEFDRHLFVVGRMASLPDPAATEQLSLFCGASFVLTFQEREGDCLEGVRQRIRSGTGKIRKAGSDYLAYALLDAIIDSYFPVVEHLGMELEALEDEVVERPAKETVASIQEIKAALVTLKRTVWPHRDLVDDLLRGESDLVNEDTLVYFRDCRDHAAQIMDLVESYRETCSDLVTLYMSSASNRMNEVMKVLTVIATIFIPLSFIAGLYGMNFNPERSPFNMPELNWFLGYPFALVVMLMVAAAFLIYLRRKGWL